MKNTVRVLTVSKVSVFGVTLLNADQNNTENGHFSRSDCAKYRHSRWAFFTLIGACTAIVELQPFFYFSFETGAL